MTGHAIDSQKADALHRMAFLANNITEVSFLCHQLAIASGWHTRTKTLEGPALLDKLGCMVALEHSELSESLEGIRKNSQDTHLPHRKAEEVEAADAIIRIFDRMALRGYDIGGAILEKLQYNATRADHKPEARAAAGGKRF